MKKAFLKSCFALGIGLTLLVHADLLWSQDSVKPEAVPDPTGAKTGDRGVLGEMPDIPEIELSKTDADPRDVAANKLRSEVLTLGNEDGKNRVAVNMMWTLLTGFLVMFMQTGFALVETGLTRAKNVAHTMAMNVGIYAIGVLGFWLCGFAFMFGNYGAFSPLGGKVLLSQGMSVDIGGKPWGLIGYEGFFLAGRAFDTGVMALFLFQMVFMDTAATIPTGAMAERWKFLSFAIYGFVMSMVIYPIYGNWVWGGGWLSKLGANYGLGHGHVDFAGSSVVHMVGGITALVGAWMIGPRIGKYNKDGTPNALPAHNVPMYVVGTLILAFGWFGFNPGSTNAGADLNIGRIATNTMLASAAGAFSASLYMWLVYKKPDPSFLCNGLLAGLVAVTAPCAFVAPWAAVLIGLLAGLFVVWGCLFVERVLKVDDPVGAVGVHGINGIWGVLAVGLFADGTYNAGMNGSFWYRMADGSLQWFPDRLKELPEGVSEQGVTGLFYGNASQLYAECVGIAANVVWVGLTAYLMFWVLQKLVGNRVSAQVELQGLDVHELGVLGYINEDPKTPEGHIIHPAAEPRQAVVPPNDRKGFTIILEGLEPAALKKIWSDLCQPGEHPPAADFPALYSAMTTLQGNRFRFRSGHPIAVCAALERLFKGYANGAAISARVQGADKAPERVPAMSGGI